MENYLDQSDEDFLNGSSSPEETTTEEVNQEETADNSAEEADGSLPEDESQADLTNENNSTTVDTQVDNKFNTVYGPSIAANLANINTQLGTKLNKPEPTALAATAPSLENSLPLYTLGNNGEYVLCTPDTWFLINGFYVPGYSATTLGV